MTTFTLPTFSGLPRWFACELVDLLPRAPEAGEDAAAGSARHAFFQRITELLANGAGKTTLEELRAADGARTLEGARELALAAAPLEHQEALAAIPVDSPAFRFDQVAAEVALALDLETGAGRELGRGLARDYSSARASEIVGTIDRLGLIGTDGVYVGDYKGRSHRTPPHLDPQFLAAALAAVRAYDRSWAEIEVIYTIGEDVFARKERVDVLDLDLFEQRLLERRARAVANLGRAEGDSRRIPAAEIGDHCRYCDRFRYCPAQGALARAVLTNEEPDLKAIALVGKAYIDDTSAPRLHALVKQAEKVLETVKEALADYARQAPFQLADGTGRWYGVPPDATTRELLDGRKVQEVLAELFGDQAAAAGVTVKPTLEGIEKAAKAWIAQDAARGKKGAIKENRERAEKLLQERGLLRVIQGGQVKVHKREA